jgi:hypothetical protein
VLWLNDDSNSLRTAMLCSLVQDRLTVCSSSLLVRGADTEQGMQRSDVACRNSQPSVGLHVRRVADVVALLMWITCRHCHIMNSQQLPPADVLSSGAAACQARHTREFQTEQDLAAFLGSIHPTYSRYAAALWESGVKYKSELANGRIEDFTAAGITSHLAVDNIKARAGVHAWQWLPL